MSEKKINKKHLKQKRKDLRNNMTKSEVYLWKALKGKQLDRRKFRRQQSIGNYIVDFYCPVEKLIIEIDGAIHENPVNEKYDLNRSDYLESEGFKLIRFKNQEIFEHIDMVLEAIRKEFIN